MKRIYTVILAAAALFAGCEEFQPVFTGKYPDPQEQQIYTDDDFGKFTPIAEVKQMYVDNGNKPYDITKHCVIKGQIVTSDQTGNVYKSFYIQDETGGIEIKIGKNGLYNDYKLGQWVYVDCTDLTVGSYEGMIQIGYKDETGEYETAYFEHSAIIDNHVFKGRMATEEELVKPVTIAGNEVYNEKYLGTLVTIEGCKYANLVFLIGYIDPNIVKESDKKSNENRFFLDDEDGTNWGITSWALSESLFKEHVDNGDFDNVVMNDGVKVGERKHLIKPQPYTMNQYFEMPGLTGVRRYLQVRSSGYAKWSDVNIPAPVLEGRETVSFTGILTKFESDMQFTLIDLGGVRKADGSPWYDENNKEL